HPLLHYIVERPVAFQLDVAVSRWGERWRRQRTCRSLQRHREDATGFELVDSLEDGIGRRHTAVLQIEGQHVAINRIAKPGILSQGGALRAEDEGPFDPPVVKRLLSEAIARKVQPPLEAIPGRNRKHPHGFSE